MPRPPPWPFFLVHGFFLSDPRSRVHFFGGRALSYCSTRIAPILTNEGPFGFQEGRPGSGKQKTREGLQKFTKETKAARRRKKEPRKLSGLVDTDGH
jgi:hypothetical protein